MHVKYIDITGKGSAAHFWRSLDDSLIRTAHELYDWMIYRNLTAGQKPNDLLDFHLTLLNNWRFGSDLLKIANQVTMQGGVVLTQGQNVLRGDRLVVDMTTGVSRVESDTGRVQGLFQSSGGSGVPAIPGMPTATPAPAPAPASSNKSK